VSESQPKPEPKRGTGILGRLVLFFLLLLLVIAVVLGGLAVYGVLGAAKATQSMTEPVRALVQQLAAEATPVILPDPVTIVREVRQLSRLETASYSLQKIITAERNQEVLWGALGESLIFVAVGDVVAGVDLAQMGQADLQILAPDTVVVHLPEAEIFSASLDNDESYVADRDRGLLARMDPQLETEVRRAAEAAILEESLAAGILVEANDNAQESMRSFLGKLGFANVLFTAETPAPAPAYEQQLPKGTILTTPEP
jgi:hypothetical protein